MNDKPFIDTNVLIYAFSAGDARSEEARSLLAAGAVISVQSLNEFVLVARRKLGMNWAEVRLAVGTLESLCPSPQAVTLQIHRAALGIAERYGFRIFDSLILAAALQAGCKTLLSEDMQHGQNVNGLTIRNPFLGISPE